MASCTVGKHFISELQPQLLFPIRESETFSLRCQHWLCSTELVYMVILKTAFHPLNKTPTGSLLHQAPVMSLVTCLGAKCSCFCCCILLEHYWCVWGQVLWQTLTPSRKLCSLWGSVSTTEGRLWESRRRREHSRARESCKARSNHWRSSSPSLKAILIKVPEIDTQNKQLWEPDPQGIAQPPRAAGC